MAENNIAGFKKLARYAQNLAEYNKAIEDGIIDENVFVIVLEEKVAKFKGQTFDWSGNESGKGIYLLKFLEYPNTSGLSEEDKANNIQIYNAIMNGTLDRPIAAYLDGAYMFLSYIADAGDSNIFLGGDASLVIQIPNGTVDRASIYISFQLMEDGEAFVIGMDYKNGDEGITEETDPIFSASPAANITNSDISNWNKAEANVQSDWNVTDSSSDAFIKNKPTIPSAVTESTVSGWGFTKNTGTYSKPSTGIPKSDLASSVQTSLGKADTALQSYTEQYKGTVTGVKMNGNTKSPSSGVVDLGTILTTVDSSMSATSTNPVQNKVVTSALNELSTRVDAVEDFFDEGAKLNLTIKSNQSNDSTIAAVKATIQYDGKTIQSGSGVIGLPVFTDIKITFPTVAGYKTPEPLEFTTGGTPVVYSVTYETEVVNVIVSAWDGASVVGQTVTINGTSYTWNGTTISHKVPYGVEYAIFGSDMDGYTTPSGEYVASQPNRNIDLSYGAQIGSWITIDQTITDPATMVSGQIQGEHIRLIRQNSHRYLGKYTADGVMTICQLDDNDSNYYHDGTPAVLTSAKTGEGAVYMKLPRFFYKAVEKRTDVWSIGFYFGNAKPDDTWKEWQGNDLIGVYKYVGPYVLSNSGKTPSKERPTVLNEVKNFGTGFSGVKWKHHSMMAALYLAWYGHTDSQSVCGKGSASTFKTTGATDILGMEDTVAGINGDTQSINFWGLENWWGDSLEYISNVVCSPGGNSSVMRITEDDGTTRDIPKLNYTYFVKKMYIGENLDFSSIESGQTSNTGYCDHQYTVGTDFLVMRSGNDTTDNVGVNYLSGHGPTNYYGTETCRVSFTGTIIIENNTTTFKSLSSIFPS